jgi:hypothetical protein
MTCVCEGGGIDGKEEDEEKERKHRKWEVEITERKGQEGDKQTLLSFRLLLTKETLKKLIFSKNLV